MIHSNPTTRLSLLLIAATSLAQSPTTPSKEYIHLGNKIIAVENAEPSAGISPATLAFGGQPVGTSSTGKLVTLTNTGSETMTFASIAMGGSNPGDFSFSSGCAASLTVGKSCTVTVTFKPAVAGPRSASLLFTDSAPGSPQSISLTGTGGTPAPAVTLSAASLAFNNQNLGTTSTAQTLTVTNTGTAILTISSLSVTTGNTGDFSGTNNCGTSLASGAACSVTVSFTPTTIGGRAATLQLADNAPGSPQSVPLTGTGVAPLASLSAASLAFPSQNVGSASAAQVVTLTNNGNTALSVASTSLAGLNPAAFSSTNTCGSSVAASASCTATVTFTPAAEGSLSASLVFTDNTGNAAGSSQTVALSGTGLAPIVSVSPASIGFPNENFGTASPAQTVTLTNSGNVALTISSVSMGGADPGDFTIGSNNCGSSLASGATCQVTVTFKPTALGARSAILAVTDNTGEVTGTVQSVSLAGTGTGTPAVSLTPVSVQFGGQEQGTTSPTQTLTITNSGTAPVTFSTIQLQTNSSPFEVVQSSCGTLAPGGSCTVGMTFSAPSPGTYPTTYSSSLIISDNVAGSPQSVPVGGVSICGVPGCPGIP